MGDGELVPDAVEEPAGFVEVLLGLVEVGHGHARDGQGVVDRADVEDRAQGLVHPKGLEQVVLGSLDVPALLLQVAHEPEDVRDALTISDGALDLEGFVEHAVGLRHALGEVFGGEHQDAAQVDEGV